MKRIIALALVVLALVAYAGIASAESGNVRGIGVYKTVIRLMESGNIGGTLGRRTAGARPLRAIPP